MILGILQARLSSTRLPGKVLMDLHGQPMILRQIERIRASKNLDNFVVATSVDASDDELAQVLENSGVQVRRGPLDDVVERFNRIIQEFSPQTVVRLTADCPVTDPAVIDRVISEHLINDADYTSNTLVPTYPDGLDVECIRANAFSRMLRLPLNDSEREHVTMALYSRPSEFALHSVEQTPDFSNLRWTVDVADDLEFVRLVYDRLYDANTSFRQSDILALIAAEPAISRTNDDLARNSGLNK